MLRSLSSGVTRTPTPPTDAACADRAAVVLSLDVHRRPLPVSTDLRITPELLAALAEHRAARD